jgi:hypothetical protein
LKYIIIIEITEGATKENEIALHELPFSCACESGFIINLANPTMCMVINTATKDVVECKS